MTEGPTLKNLSHGGNTDESHPLDWAATDSSGRGKEWRKADDRLLKPVHTHKVVADRKLPAYMQ